VAITTDRLWLTDAGGVKVADWRIPGTGGEAAVYSTRDPRACQRFLSEVAHRVLDVTQGGVAPYSIPLSGAALLTAIRFESFENLDDVVKACHEASCRESLISPHSRFALMLLPAAMFVLALLASSGNSLRPFYESLKSSPRSVARLQLMTCTQQLAQIEDGRIFDESGRKHHAASLCVSALSRSLSWRSVNIGETTSEVATALIESAQKRFPSASPADLSAVVADLPSSFSQAERYAFGPPRSVGSQLVHIGIVPMAYLGTFGVMALALSLLLGDGPLYRVLGITVARRDGTEASRARKAVRSLVIWLPPLATFIAFRSAPPYGQLWAAVLSLTTLAVIIIGAFYAIRHPHFGLPERLSRTSLVRR
jgi:hypothetical protein